jgi:quinol monooxygenase YgiN
MDQLLRIFPVVTLIGLTLASPALGQNASPPAPTGPVYVVTHLDILGPANTEKATPMLRQFVSDSRKDSGNVRFEMLQQNGRANHFTIVEVWQTRQAYEAHNAAEHTRQFREKVQPILGSPWDDVMLSLFQ